jgi:hypothetical protein
MKIALRIIAGVVLLLLVVLLVGLILPESHTAAVEGRYRATPGEIYVAINDVQKGTSWRSGLERVEVLSAAGEPLRWRETAEWGTLTFVHESNDPGRRIVSRIVDEGQGFGGTWTYDIVPVGDGTVLRITERGEVSNPLFRFMSRFVFGYYDGIETYVRDMGERLGEAVTPTRIEGEDE